jgi:hypothetical protein
VSDAVEERAGQRPGGRRGVRGASAHVRVASLALPDATTATLAVHRLAEPPVASTAAGAAHLAVDGRAGRGAADRGARAARGASTRARHVNAAVQLDRSCVDARAAQHTHLTRGAREAAAGARRCQCGGDGERGRDRGVGGRLAQSSIVEGGRRTADHARAGEPRGTGAIAPRVAAAELSDPGGRRVVASGRGGARADARAAATVRVEA